MTATVKSARMAVGIGIGIGIWVGIVYPPPISSYAFTHDGHRVVVDRRGQVLSAELSDGPGWGERAPADDRYSIQYEGGITLSTWPSGYTWSAPTHATVHAAGVGAD